MIEEIFLRSAWEFGGYLERCLSKAEEHYERIRAGTAQMKDAGLDEFAGLEDFVREQCENELRKFRHTDDCIAGEREFWGYVATDIFAAKSMRSGMEVALAQTKLLPPSYATDLKWYNVNNREVSLVLIAFLTPMQMHRDELRETAKNTYGEPRFKTTLVLG